MRKKIKAILFDLDGVLVDTKEIHYSALDQALLDYGIAPIPIEIHSSEYEGLTTKKKLEVYPQTKALSKTLKESISNKKQQYTLAMIEQKCKPCQQHIDTIAALKRERYKLAVCSNAIKLTVRLALEKTELLDYMEVFLSNEDVTNTKPSPEIYNAAMKTLDLEPCETLICEDSAIGIQSALLSEAYVLKIGTIYDLTYATIKKTIQTIEAQITESKKLFDSQNRA